MNRREMLSSTLIGLPFAALLKTNHRKKLPKIRLVETVQWKGEFTKEINAFFDNTGQVFYRDTYSRGMSTRMPGEEKLIEAAVGDWFVRDNGKVSVCKQDVFEATYEEVEEGVESQK